MEDKYWLALTMIRGLGPVLIRNLLEYFPGPRAVWEASERELTRVRGIGNKASSIVKQRQAIDLEELMEELQRKDINYLVLTDDLYPGILKNIYDPPPVLYYRGNPEALSFPAVAIVGSRKSTSYGQQTAQKLAARLARRDIVIVSGMARGIDSHGHLGTLKAGGRTIAVLGSGLDCIYPPENRELAEKIHRKGLVISEFPPGVKPKSGNFPRRNRIISGLSLGTIVVEAAARSGSLITANQSLEQGREVFAVPGNIDRPGSQGTNNLIKKGACPVTGVDDILEELFLFEDPGGTGSEQTADYPSLSDDEQELVRVFQRERELYLRQLVAELDKPAGEINNLLLKLELKGLISREPGKKYVFKGLQSLLKPI